MESNVSELATIVAEVFGALVAIFLIGVADERGIQLIKNLLRMMEKQIPWLAIMRDSRTYVLATIVTLVVCYAFGVSVTRLIPTLQVIFSGDPFLELIVNTALVLGSATWSHDKIFKK